MCTVCPHYMSVILARDLAVFSFLLMEELDLDVHVTVFILVSEDGRNCLRGHPLQLGVGRLGRHASALPPRGDNEDWAARLTLVRPLPLKEADVPVPVFVVGAGDK